MAKPATLPRWAKDVLADVTRVVTPSSTLQNEGWAHAVQPGHGHINWLLGWLTEWAVYLDGLTGEVLTWTQREVFNGPSGDSSFAIDMLGTVTTRKGEIRIGLNGTGGAAHWYAVTGSATGVALEKVIGAAWNSGSSNWSRTEPSNQPVRWSWSPNSAAMVTMQIYTGGPDTFTVWDRSVTLTLTAATTLGLTGAFSVSDALTVGNSLAVAAGGASIGGNTSVTGTLGATGNISSSGGSVSANTSVSAGTTVSASGTRASGTVGAGQSLSPGTIYRDTASLGWADISSAGGFLRGVNVLSITKNGGNGSYTIVLNNGVGTGERLGATATLTGSPGEIVVPSGAGPLATLNINTYDSTGVAADRGFFIEFKGG